MTTRSINKSSLALLIALLLIGPKVNGLGDMVVVPIVIALTVFIKRWIGYLFSPPIMLSYALIVLVVGTSVINNVYDTAQIVRYVRIFLQILASIAIVEYSLEKHGEVFVLRCIVGSIAFAAMTSICGLIFQDFNSFLLDSFAVSNVRDQYTGVRYPGLVRTFTISAIFCLATIFLLRLTKVSPIYKPVFGVILAILWFGSLLNSRGGILVGLLGLVLYISLTSGVRGALLKLTLVTFVCFGTVLSFYAYLDSSLNNEVFQFLTLSLRHAFEPFLELRSSGQLTASSATDYLSKFFWFQNETIYQLLFGTGDFGRLPGAHIPTDNGWAFIFNGTGMVGVLLSLGLGISLIGPYKKNPYSAIGLVLFICLSIYHLKESLLFGKYFISLPVFTFILAKYYNRRSSKFVSYTKET